MKIRNLVVELDRLADQIDGKLVAAGLESKQSEQVEAVEMLRNACHDLPVEVLGLGKLAPLVKRDGFGKSLFEVVRGGQYGSS